MPRLSKNRRGWSTRQICYAIILTTIAVLITSDAWADILTIALKDEESSQVVLVPFAAIWILFSRRETLRNCRPGGFWIGPVVMAVGWFLWATGYSQSIQAFWHGGAVLLVLGAFITCTGADLVRRCWPAFVVMIFLVPVPGAIRQSIAMPMQTATAHVTQSVCEFLGMDVACLGNTLIVNNIQVAVAEACNGMRMVFALFLVSYTFAFTTPLWPYVRLIIITLSPMTAIVCNVLRLVPMIWVYGHYSASVAERMHSFTGWLMMGVGFLMLMGIVKLLRWLMIPVTPYRLVMG